MADTGYDGGEIRPADLIDVEVVYALPQQQYLQPVSVKQGSSALAAVMASGVTARFPELDISTARMGIFSRPLDGRQLPLPQDYELQDKDRVEIYRPLLIDPRQARKQRAEEAREQARLRRERQKAAKR